MKKSWFFLIAVILAAVLLIIPGCGNGNEAGNDTENEEGTNGEPAGPDAEGDDEEGTGEPAWEITIVGPGGDETVVSLEDIKKMNALELEAEAKGEVSSYKGVLLSLVLEEAGIGEAVEVTITAADGYSVAISGEVAFSANTILAYERDGADLGDDEKNGPVRLVTTDESPQVWVGQVNTIAVN